MPRGRYTVLDASGRPVGTEEFRCAPGPMGWRSFSDVDTTDPSPHRETIDLVVDAGWRLVRARIATGEHEILVEPRDDRLVGWRDRQPIEIPYGPGWHLDYLTPAANAITCSRLEGDAEIDVVWLRPVTLEPVAVRQRYELLGPEPVETPAGTFDAERWRFTSLEEDAFAADLWIAGDVVVRYEGLYDLVWYEPGASGPRPV
jgi:hypothetical protein